MIWRVDTPTEDVIVAKLTADFCGGKTRYAILYLGTQKVLGGSCVCYMEDGEEIPYSAIEKWASLEGNGINGDLESKDLSDLIDKLHKRYPEVSFAKLARIVVAATKWQKSQTIEFTWRDIQRIVKIADTIIEEDRGKFMDLSDKDYYKEVLIRYNESKQD